MNASPRRCRAPAAPRPGPFPGRASAVRRPGRSGWRRGSAIADPSRSQGGACLPSCHRISLSHSLVLVAQARPREPHACLFAGLRPHRLGTAWRRPHRAAAGIAAPISAASACAWACGAAATSTRTQRRDRRRRIARGRDKRVRPARARPGAPSRAMLARPSVNITTIGVWPLAPDRIGQRQRRIQRRRDRRAPPPGKPARLRFARTSERVGGSSSSAPAPRNAISATWSRRT